MSNNIDVYVKKNKYCVDFDYHKKTNANINIDVPKSGDKFFKFVQSVPSSIWEIEHNLNKNPSVTVVDSAENVVIGDVEYIDSNKLIIRFISGFSGKAYLN